METPGERLFQVIPGQRPAEIPLGAYPCDPPFGGGETGRVAACLTTDSPRSRHGIPVLRLLAAQRMDFAVSEQTPAGHAAKLVADWLNAGHAEVDSEQRYVAELFLWPWPGIRQLGDGRWQLADLEERQRRYAGEMFDCEGNLAVHDAEASALPGTHILENGNRQVAPYGFCTQSRPRFLLDACLLCPYFLTNAHFLGDLERHIPELCRQRDHAAASNHRRLAEQANLALEHIESIIMTINPMGAA